MSDSHKLDTSMSFHDARFDSPREALQDAFAAKHLTSLKQDYEVAQLSLPVKQREALSLQTTIDIGYADSAISTNYFVTRFIGLELFLPASENHYFRNNRAAHAAVDYLGRACYTYDQYQTQQRYEREKSVTMNWKQFAETIAHLYRCKPEQLSDNIKPAYSVLAILKPNYFPVPPEILAFETTHEVSRKRNIILGIN